MVKKYHSKQIKQSLRKAIIRIKYNYIMKYLSLIFNLKMNIMKIQFSHQLI